ncbi:zinc ribbon domain-containing protein [Xenorhabdus bovienii]|uniref:zinc ribbon domain-containing protein n=1 Tax=Xenorhabdus bovienii TaxID=40576 RepID=UPI0023B24258|nr:zinc ribbon domain-containing protein [Xenorhabdus bovienii]MDE9483935.1 zinc ribbon domain-containing protein [Xenorhabdus bovienii]
MDGLGLFLILAAVLGLLPAKIAANKGRSFGAWWLYGFLLFLIAFIHALALESDQEAIEKKKMDSGEMTKCPFCAETIKSEAFVCKHCNKEIPAIHNASDCDFLNTLSSQRFYINKNGSYELEDSVLMVSIQKMKELRSKMTEGEYVKFLKEFGSIISSIEDNLPEQLKEEFNERHRYWLLR